MRVMIRRAVGGNASLPRHLGEPAANARGNVLLVRQIQIAAGPLSGPAPGIGIDSRQAPSNQAFCGLIDEVRITAEPLSPAELLLSLESG